MIISIDETGFRSDTVKDMKWQFNTYMKKPKCDLGYGCNPESAPLNVLSAEEYRNVRDNLDYVNMQPTITKNPTKRMM